MSDLIVQQQTTSTPSLFSKDGFELVQRMAMAYSKSTLVPKEYQSNPGNCIIALNMANRIGADPLMVMQNLYVVHGRPAWSSQFLIATFNSCGKYESIRYQWSGDQGKDNWGCYAVAIERVTGEELRGTVVTIQMAKDEGWYSKAGSKWKTMPEQMLRYRAAAWLVRTYAPEIAMGLHTVEEQHDIAGYDKPKIPSKVEVIDAASMFEEPPIQPASKVESVDVSELFGE